MKDERCVGVDIRADIADLFTLFAMLNSRRVENDYQAQPIPVPILVAPPIPPATFTGPGIGI